VNSGALAAVLAFLTRLVSGVNARWLDCPPDPRPRIYFANHTSHLDFVVLWSVLPPAVRSRLRPVAGRDYWDRSPLRRYLVRRVFHAVLIDRPGRHFLGRSFLDPLLRELDLGHSLIVFPEGTRGSGDEVAPFQAGLYHVCRLRPAVEAVPVYLENLNRILPKGEFLPVPLLSRATFGPPVRPRPDEAKADFLERARAAVCGLRGA
jgi:1-acyl-sn-glycerol-3-phosphate acyltransferase